MTMKKTRIEVALPLEAINQDVQRGSNVLRTDIDRQRQSHHAVVPRYAYDDC